MAHAVSGKATLCGIPLRRVTKETGFFAPDAVSACARCVERAAATPPRMSPQELLYSKIVAADAGPREKLIDALKRGRRSTRGFVGRPLTASGQQPGSMR